jgi:xylulokinase
LAPNPHLVPGRAEQDPKIWLDAVDVCLKKISNQIRVKYSIGGVGVSGQQHGLVALNDECNPVRLAKLWCDVEASDQAKRLRDMSKHIKPLSFLTAGFTSPKILWMKENEPELFELTRWIVMPHDFVTMKLAGLDIPVTDAGDASGNGIFDPHTRQHDAKLAGIVDKDLLRKLPTVLPSNAIVGYLSQRYLKILKLPLSTLIPVSVGSGDNMCSALGVGCVKPGQVVMSLGTSGTIFGVSNHPAPSNTPVAPFCDAADRHLPLACIMSCTGVLQHFLKHWCNGLTHEAASARAASIPIGSLGITFLPYLGGERTPNWPCASGAILGLTAENFKDPTVLYRACMEGISFVLADALQHFGAVERMYMVGGGAQNRFWCQMIADIVGCELVFPMEPESAALGAAFQAGAAACGMKVDEYASQQAIGVSPHSIHPISEHSDSYQRAFALFKKRSTTLFQETSSMYKLYQYSLDQCFRTWGCACKMLRKTESVSHAFVIDLLNFIQGRQEKTVEMTDAEADRMLSALMDVEEFPPVQISSD